MRRFHYAWAVAALAFLVLFVAAGVRSTPGVLMTPMEHDLGWSASTISAAVAINIALFGLLGPFAAALMQRIGVGRTVLIGLGIVVASTIATAFVQTPFELILTWGIGVGTGTGMLGLVLAAVVAARWFVKNRGFVTGILTAANATGQLIFLPILATIAQTWGWRNVGFVLAGVALAVGLGVWAFFREHPSDIGVAPLGGALEESSEPPLLRSGNALSRSFSVLARASRKRNFWLLFGTFFICGASTNGLIGTHFIPLCGDHGIPEVRAAGYLAMMGAFDLVGTSLSGWLTDRYSSRALLFWYYGLRGLSLFFVPFAFGIAGPFGLPLFTLFYGLDWIATVPPTIRLSISNFGVDDGPVVYGWIAAGHQLGAASIALVAGIIRTDTGNYASAFITSGLLCLGAAAAVWFISAGRSTPERASVPRTAPA